jgi:hypothetical protein
MKSKFGDPTIIRNRADNINKYIQDECVTLYMGEPHPTLKSFPITEAKEEFGMLYGRVVPMNAWVGFEYPEELLRLKDGTVVDV